MEEPFAENQKHQSPAPNLDGGGLGPRRGGKPHRIFR